MEVLLINVPDEVYSYVQKEWEESELDSPLVHVMNGIKNGTPLSSLTKGEVFMKMFPEATVTELVSESAVFVCFSLDWWNRKWVDKHDR